MRIMLALWIMVLGACASRAGREQERPSAVTRTAVDTQVTTKQVEDTTIVRTDTTIRADTTVETDTVETGEPPSVLQ